ncbi:MAG: peptide chain release factor 2 [Candidatus Magasanikbacteria bacterium]|nr:peptide chain release factor 2 [Candidatus Magasanikbacteria bacterium]
MKEDLRQLQTLLDKIQSTWDLLGVDVMSDEKNKLEQEMQTPQFWSDAERAKNVSKRHESLKGEVETWTKLKEETEGLIALFQEFGDNTDEAMEKEIVRDKEVLEKKFAQLEFFVLFSGKHDKKNAIVSIHAGSGGTEAQDWSGMLMRMLFRFVEKKGWSTTLLDETRGAEAGIKSCTFRVEGRFAYGYLKSEHGTHRLVRISPFDAEKMRHTSFAGIEVIPEIDTNDAVQIDPKDLRIDTFMSGGKGGQSVNTTYSAVRIVHLPTGITVQCQNERSQLQNREVALRVLQSKLQTLQEEKEEKERLDLRGEYKSAEWGNQIRSYVLQPYKLVKDVRTKFESTDPDAVLNGEIDPFVEAYLRWVKGQR